MKKKLIAIQMSTPALSTAIVATETVPLTIPLLVGSVNLVMGCFNPAVVAPILIGNCLIFYSFFFLRLVFRRRQPEAVPQDRQPQQRLLQRIRSEEGRVLHLRGLHAHGRHGRQGKGRVLWWGEEGGARTGLHPTFFFCRFTPSVLTTHMLRQGCLQHWTEK